MGTTESTSRRSRQLQLPLAEATEAPKQPSLPEPTVEWRLDEHTRQVGRRGIAAARALLAEHAPAPRPGSDPDGARRAA
jgi:hypothetical protein